MSRGAWLIAVLFLCWAVSIAVLFERARPPVRFDPETHRAAIEAIEAVLYKPGAAEYGDGERVAAETQRLLESLAGPDASFSERRRALRLFELIAAASATGEVGYALPDLRPPRAEWEQARDALFEPAPWFGAKRSARAAAPPREANEPVELSRLRECARRLLALAASGEAEARRLGEPRYVLAALEATGRAQIESWGIWARRWEARIDDALRELPPRPRQDADPAYRLAHRDTARAAEELRRVPQGSGEWPTPFRAQWEPRFAEARRLLAEPSRAPESRER